MPAKSLAPLRFMSGSLTWIRTSQSGVLMAKHVLLSVVFPCLALSVAHFPSVVCFQGQELVPSARQTWPLAASSTSTPVTRKSTGTPSPSLCLTGQTRSAPASSSCCEIPHVPQGREQALCREQGATCHVTWWDWLTKS